MTVMVVYGIGVQDDDICHVRCGSAHDDVDMCGVGVYMMVDLHQLPPFPTSQMLTGGELFDKDKEITPKTMTRSISTPDTKDIVVDTQVEEQEQVQPVLDEILQNQNIVDEPQRRSTRIRRPALSFDIYEFYLGKVSFKDAFRIIMALVAHYDLKLHQMDVRTTFLNGNLVEKVYMLQPEGFKKDGKDHFVCKLKKSIHKLKQASRQLYLKFDEVITSFGFVESKVDKCIYLKISKNIGETSYVLGIAIHKDRSCHLLRLSHSAYADQVLNRFSMLDCKNGDVSVVKDDKLNMAQCLKNDVEREAMKAIPYACAVGSLMYAQVCTRSNIAFAVGLLGGYLSNLSKDHC
ncbi:Gag-protease-integrase-RT-RNaseH polyprotein, putative [Theobroma cacao]|uniref:Gag-protease-integrase-RT-RNaseH polyprotein, putative n=1 Tax=Theobroma cacao TaxID=3641 RepID=A0A061F9I9_THECC|nr:Gag-protease-integrase-RT-RNaseH polyprotein, putative [Theobroma cacao]